MCAVNDSKRAEYDATIDKLKLEKQNEEDKKKDLERATEELKQLVDTAQCTIDNISDCNFGGNKILASITSSQKGYTDRKDYYDECIKKCNTAIQQIDKEITAATNSKNALSLHCGVCDWCKENVGTTSTTTT